MYRERAVETPTRSTDRLVEQPKREFGIVLLDQATCMVPGSHDGRNRGRPRPLGCGADTGPVSTRSASY